MKKYILALIVMVVFTLSAMMYYTYKVNHYYEHFTPHSKLVKEIVIDTRDQDYYRNFGIYKKIYKRYNYNYQDSVYYSYYQDSLMIEYWVNENKDTVCIHYINLNKAK